MYSIIIDSVGYNKDKVQEFLIKELHCTDKEAFEYVNVSPSEIVLDVTNSELEEIKAKLMQLGVRLKIADPFTSNVGTSQNKNNGSKFDVSQQQEDNLGRTVGQIIIIIGVLGGLVLGLMTEFTSMILVITVIASSIISGVFFILIGDIISILKDIRNKL